MKFRAFGHDEMKKEPVWIWRFTLFLALWALRILFGFRPWAVLLFFLGGGSIALKSFMAQQIGPQAQNIKIPARHRDGYVVGQTPYPNRAKTKNLESEIRAGQFQLRRWHYTIRSVKRGLERWLKRG